MCKCACVCEWGQLGMCLGVLGSSAKPESESVGNTWCGAVGCNYGCLWGAGVGHTRFAVRLVESRNCCIKSEQLHTI
jgi:hypothetical protein